MSENKEILELVRRYEENISQDKNVYFDADQFCEIADYYDEIGDTDASEAVVNKALSIHPSNEQLQIKRAKTLVIKGQHRQAVQILEPRANNYDYDLFFLLIESYIALNMIDKAVACTQQVLHEETEDVDSILVDLGYLYLGNNYFSRALSLFKKVKDVDKDIEVLYEMAYCYEMVDNLNLALETYDRIIDLDAYSSSAWVNVGRIYTLLENYPKAIEAFDFALLINKSLDLNLMRLKANCLILAGRAIEAIPILKDIKENSGADYQIYLALAETYAACSLFDEAMECLQEYEKLDGRDVDYYRQKVSIYLLQDQTQLAKQTLLEAINELGEDEELLVLAGDIDVLAGRLQEALLQYKQVYDQLEDKDTDLLEKLSDLCVSLEKYPEAIDYTQQLLDEEPENSAFKQRLALLYLETSDKKSFNEMLSKMKDKELKALLILFYTPQDESFFGRDQIMLTLNNALDNRTLFKNIRY